LAKKKDKADQMERQIQTFLGTPAGSILTAGALGIFLLPYAIQYLIKAATDQGLPYVAMLGSTVGNAIEEHAKRTAEEIKKKKAEEWHEANPDVTTHDVDLPEGLPGTSNTEIWISNMRLPPSADLLMKPFDLEALKIYKNSLEWMYYGVYTINGDPYWLVIPKQIRLYTIATSKKFTAERQPEFCEQNFENFEEYPACYDVIETQELVWPKPWPV